MVLAVPLTFEHLSAEWFTGALSDTTMPGDTPPVVSSIRVEPFAASVGLIGDLARVHLRYSRGSGPASVVVKLPAQDPSSRRIGTMLNAYAREVAFYSHAVPLMTDVALPECFYAGAEPEAQRWVLVLEDCANQPVDGEAGVSLDQAAAVVDVLAALHANWWNSTHRFEWMPGLDSAGLSGLQEPWLRSLPTFLDRYGHLIPTPTDRWVTEFAPQLSRWSTKAGSEPLTMVHTDCRTDNLLFRGDTVLLIDWQTALRGPAAMDLSCFLATSMSIGSRRSHEAALISRYLDAMDRRGVVLDRAWFDDSYDENLLWWMGQFGNNLAYLDPGDQEVQRSLDRMVQRTYTAALDRNVGRLLD